MKKFHIDYSDLLRAILIISAILGLTVVNVLSRGLKYIKEHWPEYRCNPIIMPLAGQFGYDVGDNFSYCVQDIMTVGLKDILQPLNYLVYFQKNPVSPHVFEILQVNILSLSLLA